MREHLLGYLMGALDASQQSEVEQALEHDPQLRQELELLDRSLEPLRADRGLYEAPPGLADRTLDLVGAVAGWPEEGEHASCEEEGFNNRTGDETPILVVGAEAPNPPAAGRSKAALTPTRETPSNVWADRWALLDIVASAGIVAAAAILFFPAIATSRFQAQIAACQNNLRTLARGLEEYSESHQGEFVSIPIEGNLSFAGVYAPTLRDNKYVTEDGAFFCPGNQTARDRRLPSLAEIEQAADAKLRRLQQLAGGDYGYNLGYRVNGQYTPVRNLRRATFALVADAPGPLRQGRWSLHHGGRGQNVLFEDGHIKLMLDGQAGDLDEIFFSDRGLVEAGLHPDDAVIGDSRSRPLWVTPVVDP